MAAVSLHGVVKRYDKQHTVIHGVDLDIRDGELLALLRHPDTFARTV